MKKSTRAIPLCDKSIRAGHTVHAIMHVRTAICGKLVTRKMFIKARRGNTLTVIIENRIAVTITAQPHMFCYRKLPSGQLADILAGCIGQCFYGQEQKRISARHMRKTFELLKENVWDSEEMPDNHPALSKNNMEHVDTKKKDDH